MQDSSRWPTVAVYWYTQTGQLLEAATALVAPLEKAGLQLDWHEIRPVPAYPFPWPLRRFFGIFPAAVDPTATVAVTGVPPVTAAGPDLVVLAYQVWYLAPSLPVRSLLATPALAGRTVLGLVACRNMWYSAALEVARDVARRGGRYLGTVAAIDDAPPLLTFVTTLRWLLLGRREAFWRFPRAGVSAGELDRLRALGEELAATLTSVEWPDRAPDWSERVHDLLRRSDAAPVAAPVAAADLIAGRVFRVWGRAIRRQRSRAARTLMLSMFVGSLIAAIVVGLPALIVAAAVGRSRFRAAVRRRLAPAVPASAGPERIR